MSDDESDPDPPKPKPGAPYEVGYGKPPVEHRFPNNNPNRGGRPKGAKAKPKLINPADQLTEDLILDEAYRIVTIREGGKAIKLPAIQASMRSLVISAIKGNRLAQKTLAELVRDIEDRKAKERLAKLASAVEYKMKWKDACERFDELGIERPSPIPHPDDLIIDFETGDLSVDGPLDEEEKARYDKLIAVRADLQTEINYFVERYRKAKSEEQKAHWIEQWHVAQRSFDIINDGMPKRYKLKLENRSRRDGASREGETLQAMIEERERSGGKRNGTIT